ncbi:hypothetical protein [Chryseobacterium sp. FH1]|uniref:hypothetical protein n=1 Tax=Chryseobacterium sp. FH1 TaxID=1233951 RepID=UPI0004E32A12|nr:hypothetical protein [Chryseobacterium sp. FH1]KFC19296.1 hypothetical protein IO90_08275 [Chryseobacterium sp. FH1]
MIRIFLFFALLTIFSCKQSNSLDGIYEYEPNKENKGNIFQMGREMGCSIIGRFEFRDGKCYFNVMGVEQRVDYEIDNDVIYLNSNSLNNNAGAGIRIIDDNTLSFGGCTFKKIVEKEDETATEDNNTSTENKSGNSKTPRNENQTTDFPIYTYNKLMDKYNYEDSESISSETIKGYEFLYGVVKKVITEDGYSDCKIHIAKTSKEFDNLHSDMGSFVNKDIIVNVEPIDLYDNNGNIKEGWEGRYDLSYNDYKKLKELLVEGRKIKFSYIKGGAGTTGTATAGIFYFNYIEKMD